MKWVARRINRCFGAVPATRQAAQRARGFAATSLCFSLCICLREELSMIYIGMDDTDNKTSRGTGRLARAIAALLAQHHTVFGITRHQLLDDPRVPYTSHNSSATIHLQEDGITDLSELADTVQAHMLADWQDGSDPGLCVARVVE